jgi:hypothetical protein
MGNHGFSRAGFAVLLIPALCMMASAAPWKPRCAVIVSAAPATNGGTIAALTEARLSEQNVQLVDRQSIDRLLAEQYLSKTGLVDAEHAVSTGKLLSADLLAFISPSPDGSTIIVFDANSGVRLEDSATTLSGAELAGEFSRDILQSIDKAVRSRSGGAAGGIKTVALQTVRNADLPPEKEAIGHAAGEILMRRLAASPDIAVLERERLSHVTAERQLTGVENSLIASTVSIELQIARDPDHPGILVSGALDYASHERTAIPAVRVTTENPNDIAGAILPEIVKMLKVTQPQAPTEAERIAEANRFVHEVMLMWSHDEAGAALDAAEAAFALNPEDFNLGAIHARAILVAALRPVCGGDFADPSRRIDLNIRLGGNFPTHPNQIGIDPAKMTLALQLVSRGCDALELLEFGRKGSGPPTFNPADILGAPLDKTPIAGNAQNLLRNFMCKLRWEMFERKVRTIEMYRLQLTADQQVLFASIQQKVRHRRFELEREYVRAQVKDRGALGRYEMFVAEPLFEEARCTWSADGAAWTKDWATLVADWIALEKQFPATVIVSARSGPREVRTPLPYALRHIVMEPRLVELDDEMFDFNWKMSSQDWQRLIDAAEQLKQLPGSGASQLLTEITQHIEPFIHPQKPAAVPTTLPADVRLRRWRPTRTPVDVFGDDSGEAVVGKGSVWPDSRMLVDYASALHTQNHDYGGYVALPKIDYATKTVYALTHPTFGADRRWDIELTSFNLSDGISHVVCTWVGTGDPHRLPMLSDVSTGTGAIENGCYVYCDAFRGVYLFPLFGGAVEGLSAASAKLPADYYQAAALLDGMLYVAIGRPGKDGYLVSVDVKDKSVRTLASGRRVGLGAQPGIAPSDPAATTRPAASPFDDAAPLFVWHMQADEAKHRIVFLVSNPTWPKGLSGWWEFRPATGGFKRLVAVEISDDVVNTLHRTWAHSLKDRRILFGIPAGQPAVLDLATESVSSLPPVPTAVGYSGPGRNYFGLPALQCPLAEADGWVWGKFGRYRAPDPKSAKGPVEIQSFDPLRHLATEWGWWPTYLEPIDGDHVVVGDGQGLWFLHVPSGDAPAMARLVQPPRPLDVPVEPVAKPPTGHALPWSSVTTIYDSLRKENVGANPSFQLFLVPQVRGDSAYVVGTSPQLPHQGRVLKFSLQDGKRSEMQIVPLPYFSYATHNGLADDLAAKLGYAGSCVDDHYYYVAISTDTVAAFPLDGGSVVQQKFVGTVTHLAAVDGKLFVIVSITQQIKSGAAGWKERQDLVRVDVSTGVRATLPIPALLPGATPAESGSGFHLSLLRADPSRRRVLFFANNWPDAQPAFDGLWSCTVDGGTSRVEQFDIWPAAGQRMGAGIYDWCGNIDADSWLLSSPNGAVRLNLSTMKVERLWQVEPAGASLLDAKYDFRPPLAVVDRFLWTGYLQRAALDGSVFEQLRWIRVMDNHAFEATTIVPIHDGKDLLMADNCGMWVAKMKGP